MPLTRRLAEEPADHRTHPPEPTTAVPALLALQRSVGNAAVARLLAREPVFNPLRQDAPVALPDIHTLPAGALDDWKAAGQKVDDVFDAIAEGHRESLAIPGTVAELVHRACEEELTLKDGSKAKVADKMKAPEVEQRLRLRARTQGMQLQEHAAAGDLAGQKSELDALLANLGAIPTELKLGGDDISVTASIAGKVAAQAKAGPVKIEGGVSGDGVEGGVTVGPAKGSFSQKGVKAELKVNGLLKISGGLEPKSDGSVEWSANVEIGTIGKLIMPEDVAKLFKGAQDTFSKSAGELARNLGDPAKVKEHGGELAGAVKDAVEKAQKSAAQANKPGWRLGAELKGDGAGGVSGSVTLTWVF